MTKQTGNAQRDEVEGLLLTLLFALAAFAALILYALPDVAAWACR